MQQPGQLNRAPFRASAWTATSRQCSSFWFARHLVKHMTSKYDHPALYSNEDAFWDCTYWDSRYQQDPTTFEWYRSYDSLKTIITQHLPRDKPLMQLGVGTSRLQVDMADNGYQNIMSIDYSVVAIQRLQNLYPGYNRTLQYAVADARAMPQYANGGFYGVLDKGTLDALLCGDSEAADSAAMLKEVLRVLAPGAAYVMITSASPRVRLPYLQQPATPWSKVVVYEVGQQGVMLGPFDCTGHNSSSSILSCVQPLQHVSAVDMAGASGSSSSIGSSSNCKGAATAESPATDGAKLDELQQALQLPKMGYSHLVYVCYKQ